MAFDKGHPPGWPLFCSDYHSRNAAEVQSTFENLKAALAGEQYEIDTLYPAFISEAEDTDLAIAERSFTWAMEAEKTHAWLYAEAIVLVGKGLEDSWAGSPCDFYVCAACGYTTMTPEEQTRCPCVTSHRTSSRRSADCGVYR